MGQKAMIEQPFRNKFRLPLMNLNISMNTLRSNLRFISNQLATDGEVDVTSLQKAELVESTPLTPPPGSRILE